MQPASPPPRKPSTFLAPASIRHPAETLGPRAKRTIAKILEATREVFMTKGYSGTTIDEIAHAAEISRGSFYTYFPSKREVLLAVGATAVDEAQAMVSTFAEHAVSRVGLREWCTQYMALLDRNGAFAIAWPVAAMQDEEIRRGGMRGYSALCRNLGKAVMASTGKVVDDPETVGLVVLSMFERSWRYSGLYREAVDREAVVAQIANAIWGLARQPV